MITFISGQNLVRMDTHGTIDAYCEVHFSGAKLATDVITADKATMSVEWYEKLYMPIIEPSISSKILVSLYDKDNMSSPELAATLSFDIENVKSGLHKELFWA